MRTTVEVRVQLEVEHLNNGVDISDIINEMDYEFHATDDSSSVISSEIIEIIST